MNQLTIQSSVNFLAAAEGEGDSASIRFTIEAYTGAPIRQQWSREPIVIDLAGMKFKQTLPIVLGHDYSLGSILGQTTGIRVEGGKLIVEGEILASGDTADRVAALARRGYQWQASVGADVRQHMKIDAERAVEVNGQMFAGPIRVVKASALREVSFVTLGADADTRVSIAADFAETEELLMADNANETPVVDQQVDAEATAIVAAEAPKTDAVVDHSSVIASLTEKVANMEKLIATRNDRAPAIHVAEQINSEKVIEAALCLQAGLSSKIVEKNFDERTIEAGEKLKQTTSISEVVVEAAKANGYTGSHRISTASLPVILRAAFATHQIADLLSAVTNKFLLAGFNAVEATWQDIAAVRSVNDFKAINLFRLNGSFKFQKVGNGGELKNAAASDYKRSVAAEQYGVYSTITRADLINDDMNALSQVPQRIGRGAALSLNDVIWGEFQADNASFYQSVTAAAGNALSMTSLKAAAVAFRKLKDTDGNPLALAPSVLLVPPELELSAAELMSSSLLITGSDTTRGNANVLAGRYRVATSSYLTNASTWWLMSNAADLNALDVVFLNGQQSPTIEQVAVDADKLGIGLRGYMDFGVSKAESLSTLRMATA